MSKLGVKITFDISDGCPKSRHKYSGYPSYFREFSIGPTFGSLLNIDCKWSITVAVVDPSLKAATPSRVHTCDKHLQDSQETQIKSWDGHCQYPYNWFALSLCCYTKSNINSAFLEKMHHHHMKSFYRIFLRIFKRDTFNIDQQMSLLAEWSVKR